jgi:putative hydrolase of HD superfamily
MAKASKKSTDKELESITKFFYELGMLKRVKRSGWWLAGVENPETIAEHNARTAIIAYMLAKMEGADAEKVTMMCIIHDIPEVRTSDIHKIGTRYIDAKSAESKARTEQLKDLPYGKELLHLLEEMEAKQTKEAIIAKDADYLECLIQAKEYYDIGYTEAMDWIINVKAALKTESARRLAEKASNMKAHAWWYGLKKLK